VTLAAALADGDRLSMADLARWALATIDQHNTYPRAIQTSNTGIADRILDSSGHG
jgi:hypothetical protein